MSINRLQRVARRLHQRAGFALLEVLISFVVLAFGMLGIAGLILTSHKANASSYVKQQAIQSLSNIADRIRANSATAIATGYDIDNLSAGTKPAQPGVLCDVSACSPTQLAAYDVWYWLSTDLTALPEGRGAISTTPLAGSSTNFKVTITVQWNDDPAQKLGNSTSTATPAGNTKNLSQMSIETLL